MKGHVCDVILATGGCQSEEGLSVSFRGKKGLLESFFTSPRAVKVLESET